MLTVNAEEHPVFHRMHALGEEKRTVVILHSDQQDAWLTCNVEDAPTFLRQYLDDLHAYDSPWPPRVSRPKPPTGQPDPKDAPLLQHTPRA